MCLRVQQASTLHSKNSALFLSPPLTVALSQYWPNNAARAWSRVVSRYCAHSRLLRLVGGYRAFVAVLFYWLKLPCASLCYMAAHSCVSSHELWNWMGQAYGTHNNILSICILPVHTGKGLIPICKHRGWDESWGLHTAALETHSCMWCLFSSHLALPLYSWHMIYFLHEPWLNDINTETAVGVIKFMNYHSMNVWHWSNKWG